MNKILCFTVFLTVTHIISVAQSQKVPVRPFHIQHDFKNHHSFFQNDTIFNPKRSKRTTLISLGGYTAMGLYMGTAWYANEDLSSFHFFDDRHEWQQMDKAGHMLGGYSGSKWMTGLYKWSGMEKNKAILYGSLYGFLAMSSIEGFDGFGESWGFSWSDIGANLLGAGLSAGNQYFWNEDRIQLKFSYRKSPYAGDPDFERLFGSNLAEWILKDYNGQTIWMSFRVHSFLPEGNFREKYPRWLNLAIGYGAEGLEGGYDDPLEGWKEREYRQLYISFDIDLAQIKTRSGFLKTLLGVVNIIRIPLPTLRIDQTGAGFEVFR